MITGVLDQMRLSEDNLTLGVLDEITKILFPKEAENLPKDALPVYRYKNRDELVVDMPVFDQ